MGKDEQQKIRHLERRLKETESDLYKAQLQGVWLASGCEGVIERADQDRQKYEQRISLLEDLLKRHTPFNPDAPSKLKEGERSVFVANDELGKVFQIQDHEATYVECSIAFHFYELGNNYAEIMATSEPIFFPGTSEELKQSVIMPLHETIRQIPSAIHFAGKRDTIPGINNEDFNNAIVQLSDFRRVPSLKSEYNNLFNVIFDRLWEEKIQPAIEQLFQSEADSPKAYLSKEEVRTRLYNQIERTFDNQEDMRVRTVQHTLATWNMRIDVT